MPLAPELQAFGQVLRELGLVTREQGDFARAGALFRESLAFHRAVGDQAFVGLALIGFAAIARGQGDGAQVRTYGEDALTLAAWEAAAEALRHAEAVGPRLFVAAALEVLAGVAIDGGRAHRGVRLCAAAAALRQQMGAPIWPADRAAVDAALAISRSILGEDAIAAAWTEAQILPLEQLLHTR